MDRLAIFIMAAPIWKPIARNLAAGLIGAALAYVIDRQFFDAQLANDLANALLAIVNDVLK